MAIVVGATNLSHSRELVPVGPVRRRAHPYRSISTVQESFHIKGLFSSKHEVNRARQFVRQNGKSLSLPVFLLQPRQIRLTLRVKAQEGDSRLGKCPLQMRVANLAARGAIHFAGGLFSRFHQTAVGSEILDTGESADIVNLVKDDQRQDFPDAGNRVEQIDSVRIVLFGIADDLQFDLIEKAVVKTNPFQVECNTGPCAGIGETLGNPFPV